MSLVYDNTSSSSSAQWDDSCCDLAASVSQHQDDQPCELSNLNLRHVPEVADGVCQRCPVPCQKVPCLDNTNCESVIKRPPPHVQCAQPCECPQDPLPPQLLLNQVAIHQEEIKPYESRSSPDPTYGCVPNPNFEQCPAAPIVIPNRQGLSFQLAGALITPLVNTLDTAGSLEMAQVTFPPNLRHPGVINFSSTVIFSVLEGLLSIQVNGDRKPDLGPGSTITVFNGSSLTFGNLSDSVNLVFNVTCTPAGTLGAYWELANLQMSLFNQPSLMDPCMVEQIARNYNIISTPGASNCVDGVSLIRLPGVTYFLPQPNSICCSRRDWGLDAYQILQFSVIDPLTYQPGLPVKPFAKINYSSAVEAISVPGVNSIVIKAALLSDPRSQEAFRPLSYPTINNQSQVVLESGHNYYVRYDQQCNNVVVQRIATQSLDLLPTGEVVVS